MKIKTVQILASVTVISTLVLPQVAYTAEPTYYTQEQQVNPSDGVLGDAFGASVATSEDGSRLVVGARDTDGKGAAYVYLRTGTTWIEEQKLTASDATPNDEFGFSVDMSADGTRVIVGATRNDSFRGAAYVFSRSGTMWVQEQKLTASDGTVDDLFGWSVAFSDDGTRVAVGAQGDLSYRGAAYIYLRTGTTWIEEQKLTASNSRVGDRFGTSISLSDDGTRVAIGAYLRDASRDDLVKGAAYIYLRTGTTWIEEQMFSASDDTYWFGYSISLSSDGSRVAIGAAADNSFQGSAYIFSRRGIKWSEEQKLTASDSADWFGNSISLSDDGTQVAVGTYGPSSSHLGAAYIFSRFGKTWTQEQKLTATDGAPNDEFGFSVDMSADGTRVIVGARNADDTGIAHIYYRPLDNPISSQAKLNRQRARSLFSFFMW